MNRELRNKDILIYCFLVISIIFVIISGTYAYGNAKTSVSFSDNSIINSLSEEGIEVSSSSINVNNLYPITEEERKEAINNEGSNQCKDSEGNNVCSLFEFTLTNNGDSAKEIEYKLVPTINTFKNLKFEVYKAGKNDINENTVAIVRKKSLNRYSLSAIKLNNMAEKLQKNNSVTYTFVFWIEKQLEDQTIDDAGKEFGANILVNLTSSGYKEEPTNEYVEPPVLGGLTPIKYVEVYNDGELDIENSYWTVTTEDDEEWYDYDNLKWANAASLINNKNAGVPLDLDNDVYAMFVWIPRYSYTFGCFGDEISQNACLGYKIDGADDLVKATPGAIDIKFVDKDTVDMYTEERPAYTYTSEETRTPSNWYTHPAFWWDNDNDDVWDENENLPGIWVGKFETSDDKNDDCYSQTGDLTDDIQNSCRYTEVNPRILPNMITLRYQTLSDEFYTAKKFEQNSIYGIDSSKLDVHAIKNSEWGAVAYLSQSKYGKYGNKEYKLKNKEIYKNDSGNTTTYVIYTGRSQGFAPATDSYSQEGTYKYDGINTSGGINDTLKGTGASTTGNIYGIYDMSGGAAENVMGNYVSDFSSQIGNTNRSKFGTAGYSWPSIKYYDRYNVNQQTILSNQVLGHALYETSGWYRDSANNINSSVSWFLREGNFKCYSNSGIFATNNDYGRALSYYSFHVSISAIG